ncbi:probable clathrin assembly protein [Claviceps purpurea 20.1]|uniref:AP-2 complex subunit sigma n=1 Tax=Claviceps purpurea (strain 20.1) TaxID=1111077 RepID=M1W3R1_CLAP2|nr:probable clathrin assembly protein [Claviceps purpurea 20.1]
MAPVGVVGLGPGSSRHLFLLRAPAAPSCSAASCSCTRRTVRPSNQVGQLETSRVTSHDFTTPHAPRAFEHHPRPSIPVHPFLAEPQRRTARLHIAAMLSFILIQNRQGKTRLAKWYAPYSDDEKIKLKGEVHRLIAPRDQKYQSNFVEFRNNRIVYRRYAGLFFCACVDTNDNELAYLEALHFFVEVLDSFFGNVCELDLVFNFYKVYAILDEVFLAGEIEETSKQVVLTRLEHLDKLD